MDVDLAFAALHDAVEQRVRIASSLLAGRGLTVRTREWDGRRCDLAVVALPDAYAARVIELAGRRNTPVLAFSDDAAAGVTRVLPNNAAAGTIASAIGALVTEDGRTREAVGAAGNGAANGMQPSAGEHLLAGAESRASSDAPALVRMACDETLRGGEVLGELDGRRVLLDCKRGRARANTLSDLLAARDRIANRGWSLRRQQAGGAPGAYGEVSMSLESFFVVGAAHAANALPAYPRASYRLRDWPDLGAAPEAIGALRVAQHLFARGGDHVQLARATGVAEPVVDAALWAFAASGLLTADDDANSPARTSSPTAVAPGLLRRLAERFGLARR